MAKSAWNTKNGISKSDVHLQGSMLHNDLIYGYGGGDSLYSLNRSMGDDEPSAGTISSSNKPQ